MTVARGNRPRQANQSAPAIVAYRIAQPLSVRPRVNQTPPDPRVGPRGEAFLARSISTPVNVLGYTPSARFLFAVAVISDQTLRGKRIVTATNPVSCVLFVGCILRYELCSCDFSHVKNFFQLFSGRADEDVGGAMVVKWCGRRDSNRRCEQCATRFPTLRGVAGSHTRPRGYGSPFGASATLPAQQAPFSCAASSSRRAPACFDDNAEGVGVQR